MYARYIPPPKSSGKEQANSTRSDAVPAPTPSGSFSYARYVPGSQALTAREEVAPSKASQSEVVGGGEPKERKKEKKRKREGAGVDEGDGKRVKKSNASGVAEDGNGDASLQGAKMGEEGEKLKKSKERKDKKDKKKKKKDKSQDAVPDDLDEQMEDASGSPPQDEPSVRGLLAQDKKEKKKKKKNEKSKVSEEDADVGAPVEEPLKAEPLDGDVEMKELKREKKEKKERKKKRRATETDGDAMAMAMDIDEPGSARHKAILEKKERALKTALDHPKELLSASQGEAADTGHVEEVEAHGLEPLPQPKPVNLESSHPGFQAMPSWIADPIRVTEETQASFTELGIPKKAAKALGSKGYKKAFAVQAAAIPLLLPTAQRVQGDVLISAATGSGKTLACAVPIVRDISQGLVTRLRAVVVLPTRELVKQAKEVFEICASAFAAEDKKRVKIGIAYGSQSLKDEQAKLIEREERYDPSAFKNDQDDEHHKGVGIVRGTLPDHVVDFHSTVDILVCTPGRLVDHINQTKGFSLEYVRWLVIDEGDKLLEQNYQGWVDIVMEGLRHNGNTYHYRHLSNEEAKVLGARDFPDSNFSGVRKVILSATLTRTGSLAAMRELGLRKPTLVVLGGDKESEHVLPATLREGTLTFRDENLKPLYLHELLLSGHMKNSVDKDEDMPKPPSPSSDSEAETDEEDEEKSSVFASTALIFTKSNESALRLSRLLALLNPSLVPLIGTLTSATPPHIRRKTITSFTARRIRLLVASDLVARGIDLPHLDHVVNYDLPASVEAYVHRVGRTARAGRNGWAWTLLPDGKESGWFWGEIVRGKRIVRNQKVDRVRVGDSEGVIGEDRVEAYEKALEELGMEARGNK